MRILDRYILKKFLTTFLFVVIILVSIVLIITFSERNEDFIKNQVPAKLIFQYFLSYAPYIANLITPITVFIATVFVTSKLASHTEIIAILSGGVSYPRMLRPFLIGSVIIAITSFIFTGWIIPNANKFRVAFEQRFFEKEFRFNEKNIHFKVSPTTYVFLSSYDSNREQGYRFTMEEIKDQKIDWKLTAGEIKWDSTRNGWGLKRWSLREFDGLKETYRYENINDTLLQINMKPEDFGNMNSFEQTLTIPELDNYIADLKMKGADNIPIYQIEKLVRYMSPFTAIILTFIGVILSSRKTRGGVGFQIALGFFIAFIYIILFIAAKSNAETGGSNPILAIWTPNIIFTVVGAALYRLVPK
ncbi:lipopolysaccharide export system permease protein [Roseivirga pacifica]|uniref:Lipopolysaccharide export system permease protein n=1 Tax=Roseivirga pacifica TaxID=1267423 RepID=A0A1I0R6A5_9BACT|nr:LptF/LptG family permease [Roseivirga pacifica]MCO6358408.1 LptF/LptG family permease [Roseivirga pacifica]MCO6368963.1 LptF/LptG family permease [Roseivirga pacifica]MCO6372333.1 LptF/LptG family permease [Roseivirga pacifica]MCO6374139.1 LptF/LptG family permease [Roseivirga pacifica]MCO6381064.1 LptF/LptG family permease [Roseivirga pacifica]